MAENGTLTNRKRESPEFAPLMDDETQGIGATIHQKGEISNLKSEI
jgi:hypothetical protein